MIFIFPIATSFSLISTNLWWKETKNLGLLLKPQSIITNNKWGLNSLRGYDDGLMPSIRSNVMLGLQNNLGLNIVKNLRVDIYYGHVDDSNFYNAKAINFADFTNTNKINVFCARFFMAKFNKKIIDEKFKAWKYGPVLEELYSILKKYGKSYIEKENFKNFNEIKINEIEKKFTEQELGFIERIFIYFSKYSVFELVSLTHIEGPWRELDINEEINDDEMFFYFKEKINQIEQLI